MQLTKLYYILFFAIVSLLYSCAGSQYGTSKQSRLYYAYRYKGRLMSAKQQCDRAVKKKYKQKNRKVRTWGQKPASSPSTSSNIAMAERDPGDTPPPKPKPAPKEEPKQEPKREDFETLTLDEKHELEDRVLEDNNIPPPTSEEHEKIRKEVADRIANEDFPQDLEPLYFVHDDDEFSVVDMEPFLVAVEYALQGRMILIEGHTDATGADDYNVKLSIQRVERIRQLMHDMGVPDDRISVIGYGEEKASGEIKSAEEGEKDRRVDFRVF